MDKQMKLIIPGLVLVVFVIVLSLALSKTNVVTPTMKRSDMKFNLKDFPEEGISLIAPTDAAFAKNLPADPYSVVLKNTSSRAVAGYAVKWECSDGRTEDVNRSVSYDRIVSNVAAVIFLHGEEKERRDVINRTAQVIKPQSTWMISFDFPARQLGVAGEQPAPDIDEAVFEDVRAACPNMTVIADGIFFDDGTFIGPDTSNFFTETKTQMDARYELLMAVQNQLRSGKNRDEVFTELERLRDKTQSLGDQPTIADLRAYFRSMFAMDLVGKKNLWGIEKAIAEIQEQLSKPWVTLRKL
jgi:hypothetical protein